MGMESFNTPAKPDQEVIAQKYLQAYKEWEELNKSHQEILKSLDSAREESNLTENNTNIDKLEEERSFVSRSMDRQQEYMDKLFGQLSEESKQKYLSQEA